MKLTLTIPIKDFEGKQLKEGDPSKDITVKDLLLLVLRAGGREEKDDKVKYDRFNLLDDMIKATKEIELTSEQVVDLKKLANEVYSDVWIYGQLVRILEQKTKE